MAKAHRALAAGNALLDSGDADGACNRACCAMFDAARAALLFVHAPVPAKVARTHSGLVAAFSPHEVKPGLVEVAHGRALNKVEDLRPIADYRDAPVTVESANWALEQSGNFLQAVQTLQDQG